MENLDKLAKELFSDILVKNFIKQSFAKAQYNGNEVNSLKHLY